ncbi:MAG TPA: hypothetical protein DDZ89_11965 [Clostridiales bacterium]|nr:hypothetical protein [Clostridiales bacterium]
MRKDVVHMKKSAKILVMVILVCWISTAMAAGSGNKISINTAIDMAMGNNQKQNELTDIKIEEYKINYDEAVRKAPYTSITSYGSSYNRYVSPIVTEKVYEYAKMQKEDANRLLKLNVYKQSLGLIVTYENIAYQEKLLEVDQKKQQRAYTSYKANQMSYEAYMGYEYTVESRKDTIADLKYGLDKKNMDFKILLNIPLSEEDLVIENIEFTYDAPDTIDLQKVIEETITSDSNMYSKTMDVKIQEEVINLTKKFYEDDMAVYWQNEYNYKNAINSKEVALVNLEYNIRVAYNNLKTKYNKIELAKMNLDIKKNAMDEANVKYQKEIVNWDSYIAAVNNYRAARYSFLTNEYNYMIAKADFDFLIGK